MPETAPLLCQQQLPQPVLQVLPQRLFPQVQRTLVALTVPSLHREDCGYSGKEKNSS